MSANHIFSNYDYNSLKCQCTYVFRQRDKYQTCRLRLKPKTVCISSRHYIFLSIIHLKWVGTFQTFSPEEILTFPANTNAEELRVVLRPENPEDATQVTFELTACYHPGIDNLSSHRLSDISVRFAPWLVGLFLNVGFFYANFASTHDRVPM